jgi:hypothetical protein
MGRPILFCAPTRHRHSACCAPIGAHTGAALHGPTATRVESWSPSIETHQSLGGSPQGQRHNGRGCLPIIVSALTSSSARYINYPGLWIGDRF